MRGSMRRSSEEDIESGARQPGWQGVTPQPGPRVGANLIIPAAPAKAMHSQNHRTTRNRENAKNRVQR